MDESIADEIRVYYEDDFDESQRIVKGLHELELVRTREIIERHLPAGRLRILDVGGGTGVVVVVVVVVVGFSSTTAFPLASSIASITCPTLHILPSPTMIRATTPARRRSRG